LLNSQSSSPMRAAEGQASTENTGAIVLDVSDSGDQSSAWTAGKSVREHWKAAKPPVASPTAAFGASSSYSSNCAAGGCDAPSSGPLTTNRARSMTRSKAVDRQESSVTRSPVTRAGSVRALSQASWQGDDDQSRPNTSKRGVRTRPSFDESSLRTLFGGSGPRQHQQLVIR